MTTGATDTTGSAQTGFSIGGATTTGSGSGGNTTSQPTAGGTPPTGSEGQAQTQAAWYGTLEDQGLKQLADSKGWKTAADAIRSYKELETSFSAKQAAASAPATPNDYKLDVPQNLPEGVSYNEQFSGWFKNTLHKLGASQELASGLHSAYVEFASQAATAQAQEKAASLEKSVKDAFTDLTSMWGKPDSPEFTRNAEMAKRAIRMADPKLLEALKAVGAITEIGGQLMVTNATIMNAFAKMGAGMYSEDKFDGGANDGKNPFDAKTEDMAMQGRLMKDDPEKAALLIKAAGREKFFAQFMQKQKANVRV